MDKPGSLLDELRTQYEAAREPNNEHGNVEGFQAIDGRLRKAFRWLEQAITYLNGRSRPSITGSILAMVMSSTRRGSRAAR
jgi:hypothetical protein